MRGIADTGFIVAYANRRDQHHDWAMEIEADVSEPLLTCESVVAEAAHLLANLPDVLRLLSTGFLKLDFDLDANLEAIHGLAYRFADQQPDLADLCIVRMSELFPHHRVVTTDRRDFTVYRRNQSEPIPLILPPE